MCKKLSDEELADNERRIDSLTERELDAMILYCLLNEPECECIN